MGQKLIIFVDDEIDMHTIISTALKKICREKQLTLKCFENGKLCIDYIDEHIEDIDIIMLISDLNMPVMDGLELLRILQDKHTQVKVVVSSAYDDHETTDKVKELGAFSFFSKPINFKTLIKNIEDCLQAAEV